MTITPSTKLTLTAAAALVSVVVTVTSIGISAMQSETAIVELKKEQKEEQATMHTILIRLERMEAKIDNLKK